MKGYHVSHPSTPTLPAQTPSPEICGALEKPMPCSVWMSWCSGTSSAGRIVRKEKEKEKEKEASELTAIYRGSFTSNWFTDTIAGLQSLRFGEGKYSLTLDQRARERSRNGGVLQEEM
ncbi:hypothetical protein NC653_023555 [Populus alba x Populus x berolinensis]|uniref:Uncharacterized protein n=1 Tax=Populus alba x Populus x berolinensis TaxID=444605 RepID=A0AAD6QB62_9ROSI|nr:hypothetical protein NC653_023555 [Populus alba x Populus x berolinensis]